MADNNGINPGVIAAADQKALNIKDGKRQISVSGKVNLVDQTDLADDSASILQQIFVVKVRDIVARISEITVQVIRDKVIVQGIIHKQIFFVTSDGLVRHRAEDLPFSLFVDVPGALPGMDVKVFPKIEKIIAKVNEDGLSIKQKVVLEVFVKVIDNRQTPIEIGSGPLVSFEEVVAENTGQTLVENVFELPEEAVKIEDIIAEIRDVDLEVIQDKVIIQGVLHKQIFFVDADNITRHVAEDVTFSTFIETPGAMPGMNALVESRIEKIIFHLDTPLLLRQKVVIEFFVKVLNRIEIRPELGPGPLASLDRVVGEETKQILDESTLTLNQPAVKVKDIVAEIRDVVTEVINDKVIVQGVIHKQIFFVNLDNVEVHQAEDRPFSLFVDIPGAAPGMKVLVKPEIEFIGFNLINETSLRQKVVVGFEVAVFEEIQEEVVVGDDRLVLLGAVVGENTKQILIESDITLVSPVVREKKLIKIFPVIAEGKEKVVVKNEIKPEVPAIGIQSVTASLGELSGDAMDNAVLIQGTVEKMITYFTESGETKDLTESVPFSILVDIPGVKPDSTFSIFVDIDNVKVDVDKDGNIDQVITLEGFVQAEIEPSKLVKVFTRIEGPGITTTDLLVRANVVVEGPLVFKEPIVNVFDLDPPAGGEEGIEINAVIQNVVTKFEEGVLTITGVVHKVINYLDANGDPHELTEDIPFKIEKELTSVLPGDDIQAHLKIGEIRFELQGQGSLLFQEVKLILVIVVSRLKEITVITSLTGPGITPEFKVLLLDVVDDNNSDRVPVKVVTGVIED